MDIDLYPKVMVNSLEAVVEELKRRDALMSANEFLTEVIKDLLIPEDVMEIEASAECTGDGQVNNVILRAGEYIGSIHYRPEEKRWMAFWSHVFVGFYERRKNAIMAVVNMEG